MFAEADVENIARPCFDPKAGQDKLYAALEPARQRMAELVPDKGREFRGQLTDDARLQAFLSQVLTFADTDLQKLYVFARHLRKLLSIARVNTRENVRLGGQDSGKYVATWFASQ